VAPNREIWSAGLRSFELRTRANRTVPKWASCLAVLLLTYASYGSEKSDAEWQERISEQVAHHQLDAALATANQRIESSPDDLEAHGWRGRVLAWKGHWAEAESEYRLVLQRVPSDVDILTGLADVLLWQEQAQGALGVLDRARLLAPSNPDVLLRRARVLLVLGRTADACAEFRELLALAPQNQEARKGLDGQNETRHEFRIGEDVDRFNYTDTAQSQSLSLSSRWSPRWSTFLGTNVYQRFTENAAKGTASTTFRITAKQWVTVGGAGANDNSVIPKEEAFFEYGSGFRLENPVFRGLETCYRQHWFWYRGAHVLTIGASDILYLPRDWTWAFTATGARSGFAGTGIEWLPSGSTKLGFPVRNRLAGNIFFAVGSEDFAQVDQIGHFSAHTFGGGLRYRLSQNQDINGYLAAQDRSQGHTQNSFGLNYGIHF
jgi:tetratricopeptide (TPR) repeat protein